MSEIGGGYDASEVDERPRSSHLSRKDVRVLGFVLLLLVLLMSPIYCVLKIQRDRHVCKQNLGHIYKAISLYMVENNDRFPPIFVTNEQDEPQLFDARGAQNPSGAYLYSWMSLVQPQLTPRATFECPAAQPEENVRNLSYSSENPPFTSSYGMYIPWSAWSGPMVVNPDRSVLFGETCNNGAEDTFDPKPYAHGKDGITIGWSDGNDKPTPNSEFVTRLAFPESKGGKFVRDGRNRHGDSSLYITASGSLLYLKADAARIQWLDTSKTEITGRWATR